jgi:hypothetical protein
MCGVFVTCPHLPHQLNNGEYRRIYCKQNLCWVDFFNRYINDLLRWPNQTISSLIKNRPRFTMACLILSTKIRHLLIKYLFGLVTFFRCWKNNTGQYSCWIQVLQILLFYTEPDMNLLSFSVQWNLLFFYFWSFCFHEFTPVVNIIDI